MQKPEKGKELFDNQKWGYVLKEKKYIEVELGMDIAMIERWALGAESKDIEDCITMLSRIAEMKNRLGF